MQIKILKGEDEYLPVLLSIIDEDQLCEDYGGALPSQRPTPPFPAACNSSSGEGRTACAF